MARARKEPEEQAAGEAAPEQATGDAERAAVVDEVTAESEAAEEPAATEPVAEEPATPESEPAPKAKKPVAKAKAEKKPAKPKARASAKRERKPIVRLAKPERARGQVRERRGVVVSSAMDKTIVVRVDTTRPDRTYKKVVRRSRKYHAHDERNDANVGDVVRIVESRPLSKTKSWRLAEILEVAK